MPRGGRIVDNKNFLDRHGCLLSGNGNAGRQIIPTLFSIHSAGIGLLTERPFNAMMQASARSKNYLYYAT
jgi:hypothetical protein